MGMPSGDAEFRDGDYYGTAVNKAARVMSMGSGGQILLTELTHALLQDAARLEVEYLALGDFRLKGLPGKTGIYQLVHPDLLGSFPPLQGAEQAPTKLPVEITSFIGRERERERLLQLLVDTEQNPGRARLVTLVGPGGTGKTRLSIESGRQLRPAFPDGVWLIELATLTEPEAIPYAMLDVLGLQEIPGTPVLRMLTNFLRSRQMLLIFDNCEHLVEASARLIESLLQGAPLVQVLASSREALGVYGETVLRVPSLPLPPEGAAEWGQIQGSESVQLFVARARAVAADHALSPENGADIAQICRRLDGIPLAIELAAARMRVFSTARILVQLDDRFRLLTGGSRTALPRLQTLRALIDWGYDLLSEAEQALLQDLSVFRGGWTLEKATGVCPDRDVLALLPQLVDKSLVVAEAQDGVMRYAYLETIRGALTWGIAQNPIAALEMAGNLSLYWADLSLAQEGLRWLDAGLEALAPAGSEEPATALDHRENVVIAWAYLARAIQLISLGLNEEALDAAKTAAALCRELGETLRLAFALAIAGIAGLNAGDFPVAVAGLEEALGFPEVQQHNLLKATLLTIKALSKIFVDKTSRPPGSLWTRPCPSEARERRWDPT
jgi:predicted ATPase